MHNVEVTFDSRYDFDFDSERNILTIKDAKKKLPQGVFGKEIWSLTCIVGNNGVGKSTVIRFLLDAVTHNQPDENVDGIIVYDCDGAIEVFCRQPGLTVITPTRGYQIKTGCPEINTFYFSGHFNPRLDYSDPTTVQMGSLYNASNGYMLRGDFQASANTTDDYLRVPLSTYLENFDAQNNYRICRLLIDGRVRELLKGFVLPQYVHIAPNRNGQRHLKFHVGAAGKRKILGKNIDLPAIPNRNKEDYINYFIHAK